MRQHRSLTVVVCLCVLTLSGRIAGQARDPGPRGGAANAGTFFSTLNTLEQALFNDGLSTFVEVDTVPKGLGPTFNGDSCATCHAQPAIGGSSPGLNSPQNPVPNPQVALATSNNAMNSVPSFITADGPVREARFIQTGSGRSAALDGGVHGLYTIQGRSDAPGCTLAQTNFTQQLSANNVTFRIPTPTFGLGLVENTPDTTLQANLSSTASQRSAAGIFGRFNTSGNDGTITRFGWKAQNKSLLVFAGEAYNVEQGVTNENFPNKRSGVAGCVFNALPEDPSSADTGEASDVELFARFMRLSAPPTATTSSQSELHGQSLFNSVGCALCHSASLTTAQSPYTGMSNATYAPYSDFALHHMGSNLADGINQGSAGPDEFRTAPLWGLGQRLFFLHDGRTTDLKTAIQAHSSSGHVCTSTSSSENFTVNGVTRSLSTSTTACGSEANQVINNFNRLSNSSMQDLLNFLRSL